MVQAYKTCPTCGFRHMTTVYPMSRHMEYELKIRDLAIQMINCLGFIPCGGVDEHISTMEHLDNLWNGIKALDEEYEANRGEP